MWLKLHYASYLLSYIKHVYHRSYIRKNNFTKYIIIVRYNKNLQKNHMTKVIYYKVVF